MANAQTASVLLVAANAAGIAASQTPTGAVTLTASPVRLDAARRVVVATTANESGKTLTLVGAGRNGALQREVLALANAGTTATQQDFLTVRSATISAAAAGPLTIGTNATASTRWLRLTPHITPFLTSVATALNGATAQIEVTTDDIEALAAADGALVAPTVFPAPGIAAGSTNALGTVAQPVLAVRLTVTAGATAAPATLTAIQAGI